MLAIQGRQFQIELNRRLRISRRLMRDESDPFSLPDIRFKELFRLNKDLVHYIINNITPNLHQRRRADGISTTLKIFSALIFFASGSYQRRTGQDYLMSMSQQSVGRSIHEVSRAINTVLGPIWVRYPRTRQEKLRLKNRFMERTGFPGTIGAVDGTHIYICKPHIEEHNFLNRKGRHSKNVQIICDYDLKILSINACHAGATHDSFIWNQSAVKREMEQCYLNGDHGTWLIGDSGYPLQPWLMTPVLNANVGSPEDRYNNALCRARNCVERCIGILKMRFRCVNGERALRYSPTVVGSIINTCAILHNMCVTAEPQDIMVIENNEHFNHNEDIILHENEGIIRRNALINNYFVI